MAIHGAPHQILHSLRRAPHRRRVTQLQVAKRDDLKYGTAAAPAGS
jgi:hypothetical protein